MLTNSQTKKTKKLTNLKTHKLKLKPMDSTTQFNWGKLLKVVIAVLTALATSLGVVSCMR